MSISTVPKYPLDLSDLPANLPYEDGINLESDWHRLEMTLLTELVAAYLRGQRRDFFVGGNMFIYFSVQQARNQDFRGPDFFFAWDRPLNPPRKYWAIWDEEYKFPDVIIELTSPTTAAEDEGIKKKTYERVFHTHEYFICDPATKELRGWRLSSKLRYRKIQPNDKGWQWCEELQLFLGFQKGEYQGKQETYLRFFDKDGNMVLTAEERSVLDRQRADVEKQLALTEMRRAEAEKQRAETEKERAEIEKQRADAAEAELARLRAPVKSLEQ